jgi:hypothetical protein
MNKKWIRFKRRFYEWFIQYIPFNRSISLKLDSIIKEMEAKP